MRCVRTTLAGDRRGATAVEFAMIAPVMIVGIMGVFDLGHNMYTAALLEGAIHKAARDSTIEGADAGSAAIDNAVTDIVTDISPRATLTFNRTSYTNFSDVREPEDYTDTNLDGTCNDGEPYEDINANSTWDPDRGADGLGSARDAVLYAVTVNYPRPFPIAQLIGQSPTYTLVTKTVLRNQPFGPQGVNVVTRNCE